MDYSTFNLFYYFETGKSIQIEIYFLLHSILEPSYIYLTQKLIHFVIRTQNIKHFILNKLYNFKVY